MQLLPQGTPVLQFGTPVRAIGVCVARVLAGGAAGLEKNDGLAGAGAGVAAAPLMK